MRLSQRPGISDPWTDRSDLKFPTKTALKYCVVFVDHFSYFTYTYMMRSKTAVQEVQSKKAFEAFAKAHEIEVKHYHADNGIFTAKLWREDCIEEGQGLTFTGVNAHHQNGRAERKIRSPQDLARPMMIHAHH